jgi:hypothetical protein
MKTKVLTITAAIGLAGAITASAQVYSQNAVGYYNVPLGEGFTMIANQLNNGDNNINTVLPGPLPDNTRLLKWSNGGQTFEGTQTYFDQAPAGEKWLDPNFLVSTTVMGPGEGAFIALPAGTSGNITLVGEVPQGELSLALDPNFTIVSQLTPQEIGLDATGFPAGDEDRILMWDPASQSYEGTLTYIAAGAAWFDPNFTQVDPTPMLGEAFFYDRKVANGSTTWTRSFSVNP